MLRALIALSPAVAFLVAPGPALAQGGFAGPGRYVIQSAASNKVLQAGDAEGSSVVQAVPDGGTAQQWDFEKAQGSYYFIRNVKTRRALEIPEGSVRDAVPLITSELTGKRNQQWRIEMAKGGKALIISALEKSLDVPRFATESNVPLNAFKPHGKENQQFTLKRVEEPSRK